MFDKNGKGYISRDDFVTVVQCSYNLLECLGLDIEILCNTELINQLFTQLFQECDMDKDGRINKSEFQIMVSKKSCLLHGLGIIKPVANYEQLRKMGPPVSFGHYSFARVLYMMCGIKSAVCTAMDVFRLMQRIHHPCNIFLFVHIFIDLARESLCHDD